MKSAGYSNTALIKKLGYQPAESIYLHNPPSWFKTQLDINANIIKREEPVDWVHGFFTSTAEVKKFLRTVKRSKVQKGIWVSWPKKASNLETDLTEQTFRDLILPLGWVDTKVCAIDRTWSGLKFLRRKN